jgi:hypothetical protein
MMKKGFIVLFVLGFALAVGLQGCASTKKIPFPSVPRMSIDELKDKLTESSVVVLDVRVGKGWDKSTTKIKNAMRENPKEDTAGWSKNYATNKTYVIY